MLKLLELLFGCRHRRRSWPLSIVAGKRVPAYTVCLECGREFLYVPRPEMRGAAGAAEVRLA